MAEKLTIEFIREQFEKYSFKLLSTEYINNVQKLDYECPVGHPGSVRWGNWNQHHSCLICSYIERSNKRRFSIEFIREQLALESYLLVSTEYKNANQELECYCPLGHQVFTSWSKWNTGYRCKICSYIERANKKRHPYEFIKKSFENEGYTLKTKHYKNASQKLEFICPRNHTGHICWSDWYQGKRCRECYLEDCGGSNHYAWNPNLTEEDRVNRRSIPGYDYWAYAVKERDTFTCQICGGKKSGYLVSHHIESYGTNKELRLFLENGICLCKKCHIEFHTEYGWGNNNRKQLEEFMYNKSKII